MDLIDDFEDIGVSMISVEGDFADAIYDFKHHGMLPELVEAVEQGGMKYYE